MHFTRLPSKPLSQHQKENQVPKDQNRLSKRIWQRLNSIETWPLAAPQFILPLHFFSLKLLGFLLWVAAAALYICSYILNLFSQIYCKDNVYCVSCYSCGGLSIYGIYVPSEVGTRHWRHSRFWFWSKHGRRNCRVSSSSVYSARKK